MDISKEIKNIISMKQGDKELSISYFPNSDSNDDTEEWSFDLGNSSSAVCLGEVPGEMVAEGNTLEEVITKMKELLIA